MRGCYRSTTRIAEIWTTIRGPRSSMRWRKGRRPSPARRSIARRVAPKAGRPRSRTWFPRITIIGASGHEPADRHRRGGDRGHRADRGAQDRVWADRARAGPRGRGGGLFRRGKADREGKVMTYSRRHPELVSGSIAPRAMSSIVENWMLKQVQHDGSYRSEGGHAR